MEENFNLAFDIERLKLKMSKQNIAKELSISAPTLQTRIKDPNKFTIGNIKKLNELGFKLEY